MMRNLLYLLFVLFFISCGVESENPKESFDAMLESSSDSAVTAKHIVQQIDSIQEVYKEQLNSGNTNLPDKIINPVDGSELIKVSAGSFIYGIDKKKRDQLLKDMKAQSESIFSFEFKEEVKSLPTFYIDKYEITNAQFLKFLEATGYKLPSLSKATAMKEPNFPVTNIGWKAAKAYAAWTGKRLPSEEEWEKAARGTDGRMWPWGNKPSGEMYNGHSQGYYRPVEVGSYPEGASPYGVMDMAGNVYEMTTGNWNNDGYAMRGGSFLNNGAYTRTMFRWSPSDTLSGDVWLGFRCVMDSVMVVKMLNNGK
ncbi:MAG: formylglycine-generating enzyme family protein [Bacteroidota bacterium]